MNKKIQGLLNKLNTQAIEASATEIELQEAYNEVFNAMPLLSEVVTKLEESREYTWDGEEIARWIRFDASDFQDCGEYFRAYMRDVHCTDVHFEHDALTMRVGPSIVIDDDGDVYDQDSGKFIVSKSDYTADGEKDYVKRNALIEAYMERTGYFPGVFESDRHGNMSKIDTKSKE